jgi:hypothetical protein
MKRSLLGRKTISDLLLAESQARLLRLTSNGGSALGRRATTPFPDVGALESGVSENKQLVLGVADDRLSLLHVGISLLDVAAAATTTTYHP